MLVHVREGRVVRVQGDPRHPVTQGFLCAKVNRYPERTHHPDRLLRPLRRVGRKGERRFEPVAWEEAIEEIAARLLETRQRWGAEAVLPYSYAGTMGLLQGASMDRRFFHRFGASLLARTICAAAGSEGWKATYGARLGPSPEEAERAKLILLWGTNTLTSNPHLWPALRRAREGGARLIAIDPIRTRTAEQCDEHLPIRPGTDAALALGLMHELFRLGLADEDYLRQNSVGWEKLRARAAEWPPERAADVTGLEGGQIRALAELYGTSSPTFIRLNYGMQRHAGGGMAVRVVSLLPAVTGAWRQVGGGATLSTSGAFGIDSAALEKPEWIPPGTRTINMVRLGEALTRPDAGVGGAPVKALVVYNSNPGAVAPDLVQVRAGLGREDLFTVVLEHFQTDTADWADFVLPATMQPEHWDLHAAYGHHFVTLNTPAIPAQGEALPNTDIFRRLAAAAGFDEPEFGEDDVTLVRTALSSGGPALKGITFEGLRESGWARLSIPEAYLPYGPGAGFATPSGRIQIEAPELAELGIDPLPTFLPPAEAGAEAAARFPLTLLSPPEHALLNSTFANVGIGAVRHSGPPEVLLHPADAAARGIAEDQAVRVWNGRGGFSGRARITERVRAGVAVSHGVRWARRSPSGETVNDTTSQSLTDLGGGAVFYDNAVEVVPLTS